MHWQSQISIIQGNGVGRAHVKVKNADKIHSDKLYKRKMRTYEELSQTKSNPRSSTDPNWSSLKH